MRATARVYGIKVNNLKPPTSNNLQQLPIRLNHSSRTRTYFHLMCRIEFPPIPPPSVLRLKEHIKVNGADWIVAERYLLHPYLVRHPLRVNELLRVLPEAKDGLRSFWTITDQGCFLERVALLHTNDPLAELMIHGALFPGLERPLMAWWLTGRIERYLGRSFEEQVADLDHGNVKYIGPWRREDQHWRHDALEKWPFWARLAILPVLIPLSPIAFLVILHQEIKNYKNFSFSLLRGMVYVIVLFPMLFLFPKQLEPLVRKLIRPLAQELEIVALKEEALG